MSLGSNGVDRVSLLRKFRCDFVARTFALIALVQPILHRVSCSNEILPNTPKHYETHQNMSLGSNVLNWVCSLQKILMHCMARTSALIAPFQPVLHRVSCSNDTLPNAPKYYETQQNMSLGSNGVDRVRSLRKIMMRLRGTNICINCTSSFCIELRAVTKQSKMHPNMSLGPTGWIGCIPCEIFWCDFVARTFALIAPV